ncbi:hypothetical protein ERX46_15485 [Brumimicrobium glaciale]|uniref:DUF2569 family protein n=1 Tax=Brumimicrobium glaciale TaxID=200475 RepID=A0A4Q4KFZ1_9FLAO|nr:hypothetical protein [Brumimicrobium glaciale]RYM32083.1 hypothetical protein ERX46_15485 [Brumimicrobium glaciale]
MKKPIGEIKPEDAVPLLIKIKKLILGKQKPDGFTRLMFSFSLFSWFLLTIWNAVSYFVLLTSDIIKENKGFSVADVIIKNGQNLGFNGEEFLVSITTFYFNSLFVWLFILVGLVLMYRKKTIYTFIVLGGLAFHFIYMFIVLGFQYFIEDVSFFDKILYAVLTVVTLIHSFLMKKEKIITN